MKTLHIKHRLTLFAFTIIMLTLMVACSSDNSEEETSPRERLRAITKDLKSTLDETSRQVGELAPSSDDLKSMTTEEISKLYAFEYRVLELEKKLTASDLEIELGILGRERWECFSIEQFEDKYRVFCRRRPQTYLRYIPRFFP